MTLDFRHITDPAAIKVLLDEAYLPFMEALMRSEWTVSALAVHLGLPLNATHYRVRRLAVVGLVTETRRQARRGRPVRHYRAAAQAFLVPYHCTPLGSLEDLVSLHEDSFERQFWSAVVRAGLTLVHDRSDIGLRLYVDGEEVVSDVTPTAEAFDLRDLLRPEAPALLIGRGVLHLSRHDAKALQAELDEVLTRYMHKVGPDPYLVRVGLTPQD